MRTSVPLFKEVQFICVTLIEKLLENELPLLVTTVNVIGLFVARPMSTYTANNNKTGRYYNKNIENS